MDFRHNAVLKEHYTFVVADADGQAQGGEQGLYNRDTRVLRRYAWRWLPSGDGAFQTLVAESPRPDQFDAHYALIEGPSQLLAVRRRLRVAATGLRDELLVENTSRERRALSLELEVEGDFGDLFEARGWHRLERPPPAATATGRDLELRHTASDGLTLAVRLRFDELAAARPDGADWELSLAPGERVALSVEIAIDNPLDDARGTDDLRCVARRLRGAARRARPAGARRAPSTTCAACCCTPRRDPCRRPGSPGSSPPSAATPSSAPMLLPYRPDVAEGRCAIWPSVRVEPSTRSTPRHPGKILHEVRHGELSRIGRVPHARYYGTVDATPLFVVLLEAHRSRRRRRPPRPRTCVPPGRPRWRGSSATATPMATASSSSPPRPTGPA
jgi:hypothetical protein